MFLSQSTRRQKEAVRLWYINPGSRNIHRGTLNNGENDEAEIILRRMIADFPDYHDAHYSLGLLLAEKGDYEGALASLETASEVVPGYSRIWYNLAMLYQHFGRDEEFLHALDKALELEPGNMDYLYALAEYYYRTQDFEQVRSIANDIIRYYPDNPLGPQLLELVKINN